MLHAVTCGASVQRGLSVLCSAARHPAGVLCCAAERCAALFEVVLLTCCFSFSICSRMSAVVVDRNRCHSLPHSLTCVRPSIRRDSRTADRRPKSKANNSSAYFAPTALNDRPQTNGAGGTAAAAWSACLEVLSTGFVGKHRVGTWVLTASTAAIRPRAWNCKYEIVRTLQASLTRNSSARGTCAQMAHPR